MSQTLAARPGDHSSARVGEFRDQRFAHARIIHDAFLRNKQGRQTAHVMLDFAHFLGAEPAQSLQAVGRTALLKGVEARQLALVGGHDEFAADVVGHAVCLAELHHLPDAGDRQARFDRAGLIV